MTLMGVGKTATASDGNTISYIEVLPTNPTATTSPGLVILNGDVETAISLTELGGYLCSSTNLPVYILFRARGRTSRDDTSSSSIQEEIDDLAVLLRKTGARSVMGIGSGALVVLYAALALCPLRSSATSDSLIQRILIFEPTIVLDDPAAFESGRTRFEQEVEAGLLDKALVTAIKLTGMGPWLIRVLPHRAMVWLLHRSLERHEALSGEEVPKDASQYELAPTLRFDLRLISETQNRVGELGSLKERAVDVLLISASESPGYYMRSVGRLAKLIPRAKYIRFEGLDHMGLLNAERGGEPEKAIPELTTFLLSV